MAKENAGGLVLVQPTNTGALPATLKSLDDWRAFFHQLVLVLVPVLVTSNVITENTAGQWVPFVLAIVDNALSVGNTEDRVRKTVYAVVGALQTGGLLTVLLTSYAPEYVPVGGAVLAITSAFLSRFFTPTTTMVPAERTGPELKDVA